MLDDNLSMISREEISKSLLQHQDIGRTKLCEGLNVKAIFHLEALLCACPAQPGAVHVQGWCTVPEWVV